VKFLLESKQPVPDFLADQVPEYFVEDPNKPGYYVGNAELLKFEIGSDDEVELLTEENTEDNGWESKTTAPAAPAAPVEDIWGAAAPVAAEPIPVGPAAPVIDSWGIAPGSVPAW
jgi:hypothetical protein